MHLFANRAYSAGNGAMLLLTASLVGTVFMFAQYLQVSLGYSPLAAGLRFMPWTTTLFVFAPLAGALSARLGTRPLLVAGLALQATGIGWLAYYVAQGSAYPSMVAPLIIAGCGTSLALPSGQNAVMNSAPAQYVGKASGTFNSMRQLGGVLGIAIASAVFAGRGGYADAATFRDGAAPAFAVAAGLAALAALAASFVPRLTRPAAAPASVPALADAVT
jgi:MFS family permease